MKYFYYTKWKFKTPYLDLDGVGPFHSTWVTESPPKEFGEGTRWDNLDEFFIKQFDTEEAMRAYWEKVS